MPLRIGFDMDGVLADFESAYHDIEVRLFGPDATSRPEDPEKEEEAEAEAEEVRLKPEAASDVRLKPDTTAAAPMRLMRRRQDAIWSEIRGTTDFWTTLKPTEKEAVGRINEMMLRYGWEVFFITQRPSTAGDTVQRQTQRWLVRQGFELPSVLVIGGSRGAASRALRLDYHVDDSPRHCIDMLSESRARPILIVPEDDFATAAKAKKLGVATAASITDCLDILEQATLARTQPGLLDRLAALVGWK